MTRFDLYTHIHKAVRSLFFDAIQTVGSTDFAREGEVEKTIATLRRTIRLTRSHAEHEDRAIHPVLHRFAPELAADLEAGHDRFDGMDRELETALERLAGANEATRISLGRRIHDLLGVLVADHLQHMAQEEARANRVLWANLSDAELIGIQDAIMSQIPPAELAEWMELALAFGSFGECAGLLAGLRAAVPAEVFGPLTAAGRARMGEERWRECLAAAERMLAGQVAASVQGQVQ